MNGQTGQKMLSGITKKIERKRNEADMRLQGEKMVILTYIIKILAITGQRTRPDKRRTNQVT